MHVDAQLQVGSALRQGGRDHRIPAFAQCHIEIDPLAVPYHFDAGGGSRVQCGDQARQFVRSIDERAIDLGNHIPGLNTRQCCRVPFKHLVDQHAFVLIYAEFAREIRRQRLQADAQPGSHDLPLCDQLVHHLLGHVGGDRKADPLRKVDDRRIDADDVPSQIEQRSTRIAGIDRGIRLNKIFVAGEIDVFSSDSADHAQCHGAIQPKRVADGQHPLSHLHPGRVSEMGGWEGMVCRHFQDRQIGVRILADHLRKQFRLIREANLNFRGIAHHMVIGNDMADGVDDHA